MCGLQHFQAIPYLSIIRAGKGPDNNTDRPDIVYQGMRAPDPFSGLTAEKIRIGAAQYQPSGIPVYRVGGFYPAKVRQRQKAGYIAVIHAQLVPKAIYFISVYPAKAFPLCNGVFKKRLFNFRGKGFTLRGKGVVFHDHPAHFCKLLQRSHGKEIRGHQKRIDSSIV